MSAGQAPAALRPPPHLLHLPWGLTPWTVLSQPHFSSSPLLHARVTAKATPAEEMAYTKAASRVPVGGRGRAGLGPSAPLCTLRPEVGVWDLTNGGPWRELAPTGQEWHCAGHYSHPTVPSTLTTCRHCSVSPRAEHFILSAREVSAIIPILQRDQ